jgi:zinc transport system substrate-binding protein
MNRIYAAFIIFTLLLGLVFCGRSGSTPEREREKALIYVSVAPQEYVVERIAGSRFEVRTMIPPGHSPATYAPTPRQMRQLSEAALYFRIGHIPFEQAWMKNIAANNKKMTVVDTSAGVELIEAAPHVHHHEHEHHRERAEESRPHGGVDPHTWLSPRAVKIQAGHVRDAIIRLDPDSREAYQAAYTTLIDDINRLDKEITGMLAPHAGKKFMVFHPAWGYFARDYGLEQLPIEIEGKSPGPGDLKRVVDIAKAGDIRVIFVQQQFDTASARAAAAEIGGQVITLDPLAKNWLENMRHIAQTLDQALGNK